MRSWGYYELHISFNIESNWKPDGLVCSIIKKYGLIALEI